MRVWAAVAVGAVVGGCAGAPAEPVPLCEERVSLVDHAAWTLVPAADDPFGPLPADARPCTALDARDEAFSGERSLQLKTGRCNWLTVEQPAAVELAAGEEAFVRVFYFSQIDFAAAEATVAMSVDDVVVLEEKVPIPTESGLIAEPVVVDAGVAVGGVVRFHVGNHGENTWNLIEVSRTRRTFCP